jgi:hypothetical protein
VFQKLIESSRVSETMSKDMLHLDDNSPTRTFEPFVARDSFSKQPERGTRYGLDHPDTRRNLHRT